MAVRIKFDSNHALIQPTLVLTTRNGRRIGKLPATDIHFKAGFNDCYEMSFRVHKSDCQDDIWHQIEDFKLAWCRDWDAYFELDIDVNETDEIVKSITAKSLPEAELSQINLHSVYINTEEDIERDDYEPTTLYNTDKSISLLDRILSYAPHYRVRHVDASISGLQRSFTFDGKNIRDSFSDIGTEFDCIILLNAGTNTDGTIDRYIDAYDLQQYCYDCGTRGKFQDICSNCGSSNIKQGYGTDTTIFVSTENLTDEVTYTVDNGSVKNCFRLEAGDDLMTATVANCNPSGTPYIWYLSDKTKSDMSSDLVDALNDYSDDYNYYRDEYAYSPDSSLRTKYNAIIDKYKHLSDTLVKVPESLVGYAKIMEAYYDTIDCYYFLQSEMMPNISIVQTTAAREAAKLSDLALTPIAVKNMETASASSIESAVLGMAKVIVDNRYSVKVSSGTPGEGTWSGSFIVTNLSDEDDTAVSLTVNCVISSDYELFVKQSIDKSLKKSMTTGDATDIVSLFKMPLADFTSAINYYSLQRLRALYDSCQSCIDILIQQGISNPDSYANNGDESPYYTLYRPYLDKSSALSEEMAERESEIEIVNSKTDANGKITEDGMMSAIMAEANTIRDALDFESYLGTDLWKELCAYRRDDDYKNENYISDGLNNKELFNLANQFLKVAQEEIVKSATLQHSITSTLKNLLAIKEFSPIVDSFELGNWLRVRIDGTVYRLRLIRYELNFESFDTISVEFSDVTNYGGYASDIEDILDNASSMASSFGGIIRQAKNGSDANALLNEWIAKGLSLSKTKILDNADNQNFVIDQHGILGREYSDITDSYDDKQLRIINRGLYLTDDNWATSRTGIGDYYYFNPKTREFEERYCVVADVLIAPLVLSEEVGIYTLDNRITMDKNGLVITADKTGDDTDPSELFALQKIIVDDDGDEVTKKIAYIDSDGNFVIDGDTKYISSSDGEIKSIINLDSHISQVEQTATDISITLGDLDSQVRTYFRFETDGLYIGKVGGDDSIANMHLSNTAMDIRLGNNVVTTVNQLGLYSKEANITTLHIGDFTWSFDERTKHLTLT